MPGAGSGYVKLGETHPVLPRDTPSPTPARSSTTTSAPAAPELPRAGEADDAGADDGDLAARS
jgi:hypothetical protein